MCDADVWIKLSYVDRIDILFRDCDMIYISDVVKEEINRIGKTPIFGKCVKYLRGYLTETPKKLKVIYLDKEFSDEDKASIKYALTQYNITLSKDMLVKNSGEIVTAIYADHLNISIIKSDDTDFRTKIIPNDFPHIKIVNLQEILRANLKDIERIKINALLDKAERMYDTYKASMLTYPTSHYSTQKK